MVTIHRKKMCMTVIKGVKFLPGMNALSDGEMKAIENTNAFKSEIKCGNMIVGGHIETPTGTAADSTDDMKIRAQKMVEEIAGMKVSDAKGIIAELGDGYMLRALKERDARKGIQEAVSARMVSIENQEGSDLTPESKSAPDGDGSDFAGDISGKKEDISGNRGLSSIPALNPNK